jgi:hypothetical protein
MANRPAILPRSARVQTLRRSMMSASDVGSLHLQAALDRQARRAAHQVDAEAQSQGPHAIGQRFEPLPSALKGKRLGAGSSRPWSSKVGIGLAAYS